MSRAFMRTLLDHASAPYRDAGRFAYHFSRGKLGGDPIFRHLLAAGVLPREARILDLGCGQAVLASWLLAAGSLHDRGQWPADWPAPPRLAHLRGIERLPRDIARARRALGAAHPQVRVELGDICRSDFGRPNVVTLLDVLHYIDYAAQEDVLHRIHAALPPGGRLVARIGDAAGGLPFHIGSWVDKVVALGRGHRLPRLYCRPLADWLALLGTLGFRADSYPMSTGKPFANVMLVADKLRA